MSQLRTAKAGDLGAFPGSIFVVDDTPPIAQCQETELAADIGESVATESTLTLALFFQGIDLTDKICSIVFPANNAGNYTVISNTDSVLTLDAPLTDTSAFNVFTVHDPGQAYLTRNESSFQRFTENAGKAHTTKGGQLFVDVASGPMAGACSDTFDPQ